MIKSNVWGIAVAVLALTVPSPAQAAPPADTDVGKALKLQSQLIKQLTGQAPPVTAADVSDGYMGGVPIAAGTDSSCVVSPKSWCWGGGDADPVRQVLTASFEPLAAAAGRAHRCILGVVDDSDDGGDLYCWGDNAEGQLGDGTTTPRTSPTEVAEEVLQVATGDDHTCVITDDQAVACWGRNDVGQLGNGSAGGSETTPQTVTGIGDDVIDLAAGGDTTCAVDEDNAVWCWGSDAEGQVGDGSANVGQTATPVKVNSSEDFVQVEVGRGHTCAMTDHEELFCWGSDAHGQLGDDTAQADKDEPVEVLLAPAVRALSVSAGGDSTCTVLSSGGVLCWGDNGEGQLGTGDRTDRSKPAKVDLSAVPESPFLAGLGLKGARIYAVSVGARHTCGLDISGNAFCWGDNADGQLGDGTTDDHLVAEATSLLPGAPTAVHVKAGNKQLGVTWKAPADNGVGTLGGFGALAASGFDGSSCIVKTTACTITQLTNGDRYSVFVATLTDGGLSFSAAVSGTPTGPRASGSGGGQLPITGTSVVLLVALGSSLIVLGTVLRLRWRRRA